MGKKKTIIEGLDTWHHTPTGYGVFIAIEAVLAYVLASLAIDSGSLWYYIIVVLLLVGVAQNSVRLIMSLLPKRK